MSGVSPSLLGTALRLQWAEVAIACPAEAAEVERIKRELSLVTNETPIGQAVDLYEQLLVAEAALADAWTTHNLEGGA